MTLSACGAILAGTGFVVASRYVVTNAHVIAGEASPRVEQSGGAASATPVLFDPKLDLAVLYVPSLQAPVLRLDPSMVGRGAQGAAIGHPGGPTARNTG